MREPLGSRWSPTCTGSCIARVLVWTAAACSPGTGINFTSAKYGTSGPARHALRCCRPAPPARIAGRSA
eukprot:9339214-Alexandrium_andersonii.AAC.1